MKSWIIYIIIAAGVYFFYEAAQAGRDNEGIIVTEGNIDAFQMKVGDCFNDEESENDEVVRGIYVNAIVSLGEFEGVQAPRLVTYA